MDERLAELRRRLGEVSDLRSALALLDWDQLVMMPPAGAAVRAAPRGDARARLARALRRRRGSASCSTSSVTWRRPFRTTPTTPA